MLPTNADPKDITSITLTQQTGQRKTIALSGKTPENPTRHLRGDKTFQVPESENIKRKSVPMLFGDISFPIPVDPDTLTTESLDISTTEAPVATDNQSLTITAPTSTGSQSPTKPTSTFSKIQTSTQTTANTITASTTASTTTTTEKKGSNSTESTPTTTHKSSAASTTVTKSTTFAAVSTTNGHTSKSTPTPSAISTTITTSEVTSSDTTTVSPNLFEQTTTASEPPLSSTLSVAPSTTEEPSTTVYSIPNLPPLFPVSGRDSSSEENDDDDDFWTDLFADDDDSSWNFWLHNGKAEDRFWWDSMVGDVLSNTIQEPTVMNISSEKLKEIPRAQLPNLGMVQKIEAPVSIMEARRLHADIERDLDIMYFNTKSWLGAFAAAQDLKQKDLRKLKILDRLINGMNDKLSRQFLQYFPEMSSMQMSTRGGHDGNVGSSYESDAVPLVGTSYVFPPIHATKTAFEDTVPEDANQAK
ncbi:mucin-5AC-like [Mya arenaria]|uniref:mucin-5AC-like n=1 Tax=Mya arenaria TaxID=6604 RepID=UPI0022E3CE0A|nr:mucin-5AC-like [Mya arenaria]